MLTVGGFWGVLTGIKYDVFSCSKSLGIDGFSRFWCFRIDMNPGLAEIGPKPGIKIVAHRLGERLSTTFYGVGFIIQTGDYCWSFSRIGFGLNRFLFLLRFDLSLDRRRDLIGNWLSLKVFLFKLSLNQRLNLIGKGFSLDGFLIPARGILAQGLGRFGLNRRFRRGYLLI